MSPSRKHVLKLPIIRYKVSTQALWHFILQYYDVRDDGKDGIKQQLIGDSLWWLKVVDRRGQSIDEHQAFDSIVTSLFFVTVQNRGRARETFTGGTAKESANYRSFAKKFYIVKYSVTTAQAKACHRHWWQKHLPSNYSLTSSLSLSLSRCPFCGLLRSVIRNMK